MLETISRCRDNHGGHEEAWEIFVLFVGFVVDASWVDGSL
jgi:hypothetical protein